MLPVPVYHDSSRERILIYVKIDVRPEQYYTWLQANVAAYLQE